MFTHLVFTNFHSVCMHYHFCGSFHLEQIPLDHKGQYFFQEQPPFMPFNENIFQLDVT